ncbi:Crp/Fnr family transcriptional regulator [Bacillus tianshenii]|uniref:Crp/Fnr family transcriptional regulator n=1 Tax=Sutcliffiella tianshenii TaxID=1463404 RepID=UPI001CD1A699|nr:Crp/Fnr family transcriptional regulator [Bacillus tianshenii]MCA1318959.1 Crp/Fnr family transcriptional regulator [Bacillus tianshenii]
MESTKIPQPPKSDYSKHIFSEETWKLLNEIMFEHKIKKGSYLFAENENSNRLFYVRKGQLKMTKMTDDGKEIMIHLFREGDLLGEFGSLDEGKHCFSAVAKEDCIIDVIYLDDLDFILSNNGKAAMEFVRWMARKNQITNLKLRDLLLYGKKGALCSTLIRLSNSFGEVEGDGITIKINLTNQEFSDMIGTSRETVNRMLAALKKEKVIDHDENGMLRILNLQYLRDECHCESCPVEVCRI